VAAFTRRRRPGRLRGARLGRLAWLLVQLPEPVRRRKMALGRIRCQLAGRSQSYRLGSSQLGRTSCRIAAAHRRTRNRLVVQRCWRHIGVAHQRTRSSPLEQRCCGIGVARQHTRSKLALVRRCCTGVARQRTQSRRLGPWSIAAARRHTRSTASPWMTLPVPTNRQPMKSPLVQSYRLGYSLEQLSSRRMQVELGLCRYVQPL